MKTDPDVLIPSVEEYLDRYIPCDQDAARHLVNILNTAAESTESIGGNLCVLASCPSHTNHEGAQGNWLFARSDDCSWYRSVLVESDHVSPANDDDALVREESEGYDCKVATLKSTLLELEAHDWRGLFGSCIGRVLRGSEVLAVVVDYGMPWLCISETAGSNGIALGWTGPGGLVPLATCGGLDRYVRSMQPLMLQRFHPRFTSLADPNGVARLVPKSLFSGDVARSIFMRQTQLFDFQEVYLPLPTRRPADEDKQTALDRLLVEIFELLELLPDCPVRIAECGVGRGRSMHSGSWWLVEVGHRYFGDRDQGHTPPMLIPGQILEPDIDEARDILSHACKQGLRTLILQALGIGSQRAVIAMIIEADHRILLHEHLAFSVGAGGKLTFLGLADRPDWGNPLDRIRLHQISGSWSVRLSARFDNFFRRLAEMARLYNARRRRRSGRPVRR